MVRAPNDADIAKLLNVSAADALIRQPAIKLVELLTGLVKQDKTGMLVIGGHIIQGALKWRLWKQLLDEYQTLLDDGKIVSDPDSSRYGFKTWADLAAIIDSDDPPDADRLEALKAAFYAVNKLNQEDKERTLAYQLWRVATKLESADVLLLKIMAEKEMMLNGLKGITWANQAAELIGLQPELVRNSIERLAKLRVAEASDSTFCQAKLRNLGQRIVQNIKTYEVDLAAAKGKKKPT